jgi:hypothetical protein
MQHSRPKPGALAGVTTLEGYSEWMKHLFTRISDGHYELRFLAVDEPRNSVAGYAVFHGREGNPASITAKTFAADYVYVMVFEGNRI